MSYGWWQHKHTRHHANPNKIGSDPDIDLPVISFTPSRRRVDGRPPWSARLGDGASGRVLLPDPPARRTVAARVGHAPRRVREPLRRRPVEIAFLVARLVGSCRWSSSSCLRASRSRSSPSSSACSASTWEWRSLPITRGCRSSRADVKVDFLQRQVLMSRNIRGGRFIDTAMGGLNYQIEHHLFPSMPRPHLRQASGMIAASAASTA